MFSVMSGSIVIDGPEARRPAVVLRDARGLRRLATQAPGEGVVHLGEGCEEEVRHPLDRLEPGGRCRTLLWLDRRTGEGPRQPVHDPAIYTARETQQVVEAEPRSRRTTNESG